MLEKINHNTNILSILFTKGGFSYLYKTKSKTKSEEVTILSDSEEEYLEKVNLYFNQHKILSKEYDEVYSIFQTHNFSLIPNHLFDENYIANYLKFNNQISKKDPLRYNFDLDRKFVFAFSYPERLEKFLSKRYKNITYYHSLFSFIQNLKSLNYPIEFHINFYANSFDLVALENNDLIFTNSFNYSSNEDLLYHLLNISKANGLFPKKIPLVIYGRFNMKDTLISELKTHFNSINISIENSFIRKNITLN